MTALQLHDFAISRHDAPEVCKSFRPRSLRGRREDRVRAAPAVSCANMHKENAHEHTGSAESIRPSLRNGFTAYNALSPVTGLFATVAPRINPRHLTPASGRQNHATSPSASAPFVKGTSASTASHRAFRDDREPPLLSGETRGETPLICPTRQAEYFFEGGWTGFFDFPVALFCRTPSRHIVIASQRV